MPSSEIAGPHARREGDGARSLPDARRRCRLHRPARANDDKFPALQKREQRGADPVTDQDYAISHGARRAPDPVPPWLVRRRTPVQPRMGERVQRTHPARLQRDSARDIAGLGPARGVDRRSPGIARQVRETAAVGKPDARHGLQDRAAARAALSGCSCRSICIFARPSLPPRGILSGWQVREDCTADAGQRRGDERGRGDARGNEPGIGPRRMENEAVDARK